MPKAYYNENDKYAAAWLRNLIAAGHIAPGDVDERSIEDVRATDVAGYTQCHWFAGIGGWSYALRLAGWADDRVVWTGSCPCQPLSSAGAHKGHADERHLWPAFYGLIAECRPATVFGEQVASKDGREWLAGVRADLEDTRYALGAADLCAASSGAPHIRQRLWWVAYADGGDCRDGNLQRSGQYGLQPANGSAGRLGHTAQGRQRIDGGAQGRGRYADQPSATLGVGDSDDPGPQGQRGYFRKHDSQGREVSAGHGGAAGFWGRADGLLCADGKTRRIESGTFPLAHGLPARMGRLRAYGNAIVPQVAAAFIQAVM